MAEKTDLERFINASGEFDGELSDKSEDTEVNDDAAENIEAADIPDEPKEAAEEKETYGDEQEEADTLNSAMIVTKDLMDAVELVKNKRNASEKEEGSSEEETIPEKAPAEESVEKPESSPSKNEKPSRGASGLGVANVIIASLTLCAVAAGFFLTAGFFKAAKADSDEKQKRIEELEEEKELIRSDYIEAMNIINESDSENEPPLYSDEALSGKILIYDSDIGYSWVPVLSSLPLNTYRRNSFYIDERGRMSYSVDDKASSYFGIDVSSYQGDINWQLAREDGVEFAFLRIGYRGYGEEGNIREDEKFVQNYGGAHEAGVDIGVYFFSQAITPEEAAEEAQFLLSILDGRPLEYPVVFDWESVATTEEETARTDDVMPQTLTLSALAFCETIRDAGYDVMIYTNKKTAVMKYDMRQLKDYPVWLAYYNTELNYCYDFDIWQYGTGLVDGIEGEVDLNIAMIK